jgi:predicted membrane protein
MEGGVSAGLMKSVWNQIEVNPKKIREFGLVIFTVAGLIVPFFISYRHDWGITSWVIHLFVFSSLFLFLNLAVPKVFYGLFRLWMMIALGLGFIVTRIIVTTVYLLMMTPVGIIRRQKKGSVYRTFLDFDKAETESYWIRRDSETYDSTQTERQF